MTKKNRKTREKFVNKLICVRFDLFEPFHDQTSFDMHWHLHDVFNKDLQTNLVEYLFETVKDEIEAQNEEENNNKRKLSKRAS